ncbi:hypothetical protein Goshw_025848 [Gossypium schwendimanii]|uniref:RNase H type-1 domain-containing protein n=1 Tax=Gossypium schwendimanii TaxID=34291 RepID=A0A7J9L6S6_GOSSC|nr:hypothetical protein [Gossypium schwendimanii]
MNTILALGRLIGNVYLGFSSSAYGKITYESSQRPCSCSNLSEYGIYLNTDGSVRLEDGSATAGGIVRNRIGKWILDFNKFLESYSVFEAELWGILDGLGILIDRGYKEVQIRIGSIEVASAIHEISSGGPNTTLIRRILQLLSWIKL